MRSKYIHILSILVCLSLLLSTACGKKRGNIRDTDINAGYQESSNTVSNVPSTSVSASAPTKSSDESAVNNTTTTAADNKNTQTAPVETTAAEQTGTSNAAVETSVTKNTETQIESTTSAATPEIDYKVFFQQEGTNYTLIADSISRTFLVMDKSTKSIRQTGYQYINYFEIFPGGKNPILGSSGDLFVFLSKHQVIASDGKKEWVLETVGDESMAEQMQTGYIEKHGNKTLAYIFSNPESALLLIDFDKAAAYKFTDVGFNSEKLTIFSSDYILIGDNIGNMSAGYECLLYKLYNGESKLIGIIEGFNECEYDVEGNIVNIYVGSLSYRIDLESNEITSSIPISDERRLYYPVFCTATIGGLSEMRFIHDDQAMSIELPENWTAYCWYFGDYWRFGINNKDRLEVKLPRTGFAYFHRLEPKDDRPITKFPEGSTIKEVLYSGLTFIGEGEIYLLEWTDPYISSDEENETYELIYAFIPIGDGSKAYELNINVPVGEEPTDYFYIMKSLLKIDDGI